MNNAHIQILGWNHRAYLEACITSCMRQTVEVPVVYVDNASHDDSVSFVRERFSHVRVIENVDNRGYSGGHNDGLRAVSDSEIVILLNPDVVLERECVEELLKAFDDPSVGAAVPLLLRPVLGNEKRHIDSFGIRLTRSLRGVNQYEGQIEDEFIQQKAVQDPWGFTGAVVALRRTALNDVAYKGEIFDEDLFAYREDVDVSWRLRHGGWNIKGIPTARATHVRAIAKGKTKPTRIKQLSWRNYYLVIMKNASMKTILKNIVFILTEDILRTAQLIISPSLWPAAVELFRLVPRFARKRQYYIGL